RFADLVRLARGLGGIDSRIGAQALRVFNGADLGCERIVRDERCRRPGRSVVSPGPELPMDITTSIGLIAGIVVVSLMIFIGGDLHMFISEHAIIIIFGGSIAATLIRFPLSAILHGLPLGAKFAFTMSRLSARDLVDELARIAEIARKQGPVGLEKVETNEPFL